MEKFDLPENIFDKAGQDDSEIIIREGSEITDPRIVKEKSKDLTKLQKILAVAETEKIRFETELEYAKDQKEKEAAERNLMLSEKVIQQKKQEIRELVGKLNLN